MEISEIETQIMSLLDEAAAMKLELSEDDAQYNLMFVREKVAKCSSYQEKISDVMMKLTRVSIEVQKVAQGKKLGLLYETNSLKESKEYKEMPRNEKTSWLNVQLAEAHEETESWTALKRVVSEVKEAIGERANLLKRLDSDLRLHTKLLELVKEEGLGASLPSGFPGSASKEVDID